MMMSGTTSKCEISPPIYNMEAPDYDDMSFINLWLPSWGPRQRAGTSNQHKILITCRHKTKDKHLITIHRNFLLLIQLSTNIIAAAAAFFC
jgi:hypothetical protein